MVMPFEDPLLNYMELFNESSLLVTSYFLLTFTDFVPEPETRYTIGWVFSGVVALNLIVNWIILFTRLAKQIIAFVKTTRLYSLLLEKIRNCRNKA